MGDEGHRILGKTLSTTRVDALELILHLTVKIGGLVYFAAISKICYTILKFAKKQTNNNIKLQNQYNLLFWKTRRPRTARVVAHTFTMYRIACVARFLKVPANFPA